MRLRKTILVAATAIVVVALIGSCNLFGGPTGSAANSPSSAFFTVPDALTGEQDLSARSAVSDVWVTDRVNGYYEYVRGQIRFGAELANSIRTLIQQIESVTWGDGYLLDQDVSLVEHTTSDSKIRFKTVSTDNWSFESWQLDGTKVLELTFAKNAGGGYTGTAIVNGTVTWGPGMDPSLDAPDFVHVAFDSSSDGSGTIDIQLEDFRVHPDLADATAGGEENLIIKLSRDTGGTVSIGSIAKVDNSRHFVWDGYDYSGNLDTGSTAETRYYVAAGKGTTGEQATVYLGIPKAFDSAVFTSNSVGDVVAQLFTDRLNNDYDFGAESNDNGYEVIDQINALATNDISTSPYTSSAAVVETALGQAQAALGTPSDIIDYLVDMMAIENPAYFNASSYTGNGASAPASGYPTLTEADARALLPPVADVDTLAASGATLGFASSAAPGF